MSFTAQWVEQQNAKRAAKIDEPANADPRLESKIHADILDYCKSKRWYVVRSRMDRATTSANGTPDFIIATKTGVLWVEVKRKGNKPTQEQVAANYWLKSLGQQAHIVWSFEEFLHHAKGHL